MKYTFTVPFLPPSVNSLYKLNHNTRSMYLSEEGCHFKMAIKLSCPPMKFSSEHPFLDCILEYHSPRWICKNGNVRKQDGMNMDKVIYDAISERIGIDDCHIFVWKGVKVLGLEEFTKITIDEITEEDLKELSNGVSKT